MHIFLYNEILFQFPKCELIKHLITKICLNYIRLTYTNFKIVLSDTTWVKLLWFYVQNFARTVATTNYNFIWVLCPRTLSHMSQTFFNSIVKTSNIKKFTQYTELHATQFLKNKNVRWTLSFIGRSNISRSRGQSFQNHDSIYNNRVIFLGQLSINHGSTCIWNVISFTARLNWRVVCPIDFMTRNPMETHEFNLRDRVTMHC